ncbi:MAG: hypothetical protein QM503_12660 [Bacteroidota bacterium]
MTKKIKSLSVLTVAILAGLFVTFSTLDIQANQIVTNDNSIVSELVENSAIAVIAVYGVVEDNKCGEGKCGEGKCGGAEKETKKEAKVEKTGAAKTATTEEGKCGEGKCGGAEKKEGKAEKKESKTEKKAESKCGEGKCGVA